MLTGMAIGLLAPVLGLLSLLLLVSAPQRPTAQLSVFSVGAGQAATVITQNKAVLLDAGPAQPRQIGAIGRELHPHLSQLGIRDLNLVLLSHGDSDHAGGLAGIRARFGIHQLLSGEPDRSPTPGCAIEASVGKSGR